MKAFSALLIKALAVLLLLTLFEVNPALATAETAVSTNSANDSLANTNTTSNAGEEIANVETSQHSQDDKKTDSVKPIAEQLISNDLQDRAGKVIAQYTTHTKAVFVTTTLTALSTCFSATNVACGRRRKRNLVTSLYIDNISPNDSKNYLLSSQSDVDHDQEDYQAMGDTHLKGRRFTIWSTLFSTYILTSTYYWPGTTVTVSGICSIAGLGSSCFG